MVVGQFAVATAGCPSRLWELANAFRPPARRARTKAAGGAISAISLSTVEAFSSPEASPDWPSVTPVSAATEIGMHENAVPAPLTRNGPGEVGQEVPVNGGLGCPDDPSADQGHPDSAITIL